jgi:hypothetical protein
MAFASSGEGAPDAGSEAPLDVVLDEGFNAVCSILPDWNSRLG